MPEERNTAVPVMDKAAWDEAREGVPRETQAARLIVSRKIGGIPYRPYLTGDCDNAPVVKAVGEFAGLVYDLLDRLADEDKLDPTTQTAFHRVHQAMEDFTL